MGRPTIYLNLIVHTAPSAAELAPRYVPQALALLDEAVADLTAHPPAEADLEMLQTLDFYGDCLLRLGRPNEAIAKWQRALDNFPSAPEFPQIEAKIIRALGIK